MSPYPTDVAVDGAEIERREKALHAGVKGSGAFRRGANRRRPVEQPIHHAEQDDDLEPQPETARR